MVFNCELLVIVWVLKYVGSYYSSQLSVIYACFIFLGVLGELDCSNSKLYMIVTLQVPVLKLMIYA